MTYRSAILGCGPRAAYHIAAYKDLENMTLVAACDKDAERLRNYGRRFGIPGLYEDFETMLRKEKPDVLHIVAPPRFREEPIGLAARYGVRAVIVEKPLALNIPQARAIREIAAQSGIKVVVNTQRRYSSAFRAMKEVIWGGTFGDIRFLRMVTRGNILAWGPHVLDLVLFLLGDAAPTRVWAAAYGMNGQDYGHPAPASMLIALTFPGDVMVYIEAADDAVGVPGVTGFWDHAEFDVWGTCGRAWWTASKGWGYQHQGDPSLHAGPTGFELEEPVGQREFTRAVGLWLDDERNPHGCRLDTALLGFDITMTALLSAYQQRRLNFPTSVPDNITDLVAARLKGGGGT